MELDSLVEEAEEIEVSEESQDSILNRLRNLFDRGQEIEYLIRSPKGWHIFPGGDFQYLGTGPGSSCLNIELSSSLGMEPPIPLEYGNSAVSFFEDGICFRRKIGKEGKYKNLLCILRYNSGGEP